MRITSSLADTNGSKEANDFDQSWHTVTVAWAGPWTFGSAPNRKIMAAVRTETVLGRDRRGRKLYDKTQKPRDDSSPNLHGGKGDTLGRRGDSVVGVRGTKLSRKIEAKARVDSGAGLKERGFFLR